MDKNWNHLKLGGKLLVAGSVVGALIAGCGGGGGNTPNNGNNPGGSSASSLNGVAAAGAPVANGIGYALDAATGTQIAFTTNATTGGYSVDLTGHSGPFLLHVRGITSGGSPVDLYSLASSANFGSTVNVTPLSDVVVGYAAGQTAANLETACTANQAACPGLLNGVIGNLALSNSSIVGAIPASVLAAFNVSPSTFNAITTSFAATHSGVDGLLDALLVVPPVSAGTTYAINLNGATPTPLVTIPVAGTGSAPTTNPTAPTAAAVTQAANLATALAEVQAWVAAFNQSMTAAAPGYPTAASISAGLDPTFLLDGANGTAFANAISSGQAMSAGSQIIAGGLAPYSGAAWGAAAGPAASVTYDANNCVTSLWSYFGANSLISGIWSFNKTITNPTGCVGTWKLAGDQTQYYDELHALFEKSSGGGATSYWSGFQIDTSADDTLTAVRANPYASVTVSGPGLTTQGNFAAKGAGVAVTVPVTLLPPAGFSAAKAGQNIQNAINDAYYGGSSVLEDCAALKATASSATPCYDGTAAIAGSDYVVKFNDAGGAVLETVQYRLNTSLAVTSVPVSWYPTITGVTPAQASQIPANTATTVTYTWTLPAGARADWGGVWLNNAAGARMWQNEQPVTAATSNTINVPATNAVTATPASGGVSVLAPLGGLKVGSTMGF